MTEAGNIVIGAAQYAVRGSGRTCRSIPMEDLMVRVYAGLRTQGDGFNPSEAERLAGVAFSTKSEPGEIGTMGRYAGSRNRMGARSCS